MAQRVEEDGKSERQPVVGWIGASSPRASGLTSIWSSITREFEEPIKETKQMTVVQPTGAVSHPDTGWHNIHWHQAHQAVRRLQARIVKATQQGKWGKVKALQRLLTHSFSAKVLAVKRVTDNQGKNTPGVDGDIWDTPQKKMQGVHSLQQHGYKPLPLRRIYIPKSSNPRQKRPLSIPVMRDRAMQALYLLALEPIAETTADPNSYGFRPERNCADAIEQCFAILAGDNRAAWILEGDIKGCFDNISHEWLMTHIPMDKVMLRQWLKAGFMDKGQLFPTYAGTPQGGVASPVLANLVLDGLERLLRQRFPMYARNGQRAKVNLVRYADDFIITGISQAVLENEVKPLVERFLHERGLTLSPDKTHITHISEGFDFLGQNIRKYDGKLLIKPSTSSVKRLLKKVRDLIRRNPTVTAGKLIWLLNPTIRGWAQYHRHVVSSATFQSVDHQIFRALWRWATRRHPKKSRWWIKDKYFQSINGRNWVFSGEHNGKAMTLFAASGMPIRRHIKVRSEANPFDPDWEIYFEQRLGVKMVGTLHGRRQLIHLWKEQQGMCPVCQQKITTLTGWHNHHLVWRSRGGADKAFNRVLLHPNCHRLIHSQELSVEKPRPAPASRALAKA
jgi:RNA-directed DNA polymerase